MVPSNWVLRGLGTFLGGCFIQGGVYLSLLYGSRLQGTDSGAGTRSATDAAMVLLPPSRKCLRVGLPTQSHTQTSAVWARQLRHGGAPLACWNEEMHSG